MNNYDALFQNKSGRRVAIVHSGVEYGGMEVYIAKLLRHLDPDRYAPALVVDKYQPTDHRLIKDAQADNIPVIQIPATSNLRGLSFAQDVLKISSILRAARFDVMHIQTFHPSWARAFTIGARLGGVRAVLRTEHMPPSEKAGRYAKFTVKPFDFLTNYIIADSDDNRADQIKTLQRNPKKVYRSYCGIELERYNPNHDVVAAKRRIGLDPNLPVIGTVGRLDEEKGHKYLIEAAAKVIKEFGAVNFLLVGNGKLETELKAQVASLGINDYIHFAGFQPDSRPYMEAMDITTMSSLFEGFSLAMLDYMAMGKPSVVTNHPSFQEAVVDGESGIIVPMRSADGLAEGYLKLLRDPMLAAKMGQAALQRVRSEFSIERLANDMMNLYDKILQGQTIKVASPKSVVRGQ